MKLKKYYYFQFTLTFFVVGCHTYLIDKNSTAQQMSNLKIERKLHTMIEPPSGAGSGSAYHSNLKYLIIKNDSLNYDTIIPFDVKYYLKSGINSGWRGVDRTIFENEYFTTYSYNKPNTIQKCKFCKIHIDSIEKILVRGPRLNKKK